MSFPVSITKITIGATFIKSDGSPCTGMVTFRPSTTAVVDEYIFPTKPINAPLHPDGSFSVSLVATDDPDWDIPGATYEVIERINGVDPWRTYNIQVPYDSPGGLLDLATVAPVDPPPVGGGGDPGTLDPDLVTIGNLIPSNNDVIQRKAGNWTSRSPAQLKTDLALVKDDVGLGSVDNTTDLDKPISTATQAALALKADVGSAITPADIGLGNVDNTSDLSKPVSTATQTQLNLKANLTDLTKANVGLGNVDNTSDANKPISTATQTALNAKASTTYVDAADATLQGNISTLSGTVAAKADTSALTAHTGNTSNPHSTTAAQVGLGNVDNTSDVAKPVSTAQQTALNLKAPLASPTFTGTVSGVTKAMVGLSAVDNTADTAKPVSTAQQTALNGKLDTSVATTKGDLFVATAAGVVTRLGVGTNGQVVTADSVQASGVKWATPAAGGSASPINAMMLQMNSGKYYSTPPGAIGGNTNGTLAACYLVPFVPARSGNINSLSVDVAAAGGATSVVRLGIASSNANNEPSAWLADFGTIAVGTATNAQTLSTMTFAVTAGTLYWIGIVAQVAAVGAFRAVNGNGTLIGLSGTPPFGSLRDSGFVSTGWTGALTGPITLNSTSNSPAVAVRMA